MTRFALPALLLLGACASRAPAPAPDTSPRVVIEPDRIVVSRGGETTVLADRAGAPDLPALAAHLGDAAPGETATVELADDARYADLGGVVGTLRLRRFGVEVGELIVAERADLPASDIPALEVSNDAATAGLRAPSDPVAMTVRVNPGADGAYVLVAAARIGALEPRPSTVLLVIDPDTRGAVVNGASRALRDLGVTRAVFEAAR